MKKLHLTKLVVGLLAFAWLLPVFGEGKGAEAYKNAVANPYDEQVFEAYLTTLPKVKLPGMADTDFYIAEGDLLKSKKEVRILLVDKAQYADSDKTDEAYASGSTPELIVDTRGGAPRYWPRGSRELTYAVDRKSFPSAAQYDVAVKNMEAAGREWTEICPAECEVVFKHLPQFDDAPSHADVLFVVTFYPSNGEFIAAAFFPGDPDFRRFVLIDPSYFATSADKVGVLRHELGHVLGYRHEHTRGVWGCFYEDNQWQPLTFYDPYSVMHYPCGGVGSLGLEITQVDRDGHRSLYSR